MSKISYNPDSPWRKIMLRRNLLELILYKKLFWRGFDK